MNHPVKLGDQAVWHRDFNEEKRYQYQLDKSSVVVDIGAFDGEFAEKILHKFGCNVYIFEPTDAIEQWAHWYGGGRVQIFRKAAWTYDGKLKMGGESFWVSTKEQYNFTEVDCVDIATHFPQSVVDLCKINIEGGEYELLLHMVENNMMPSIRNLQVQFHLIDGEGSELMYNTIEAVLRKTHKLSWRCPFVWESWELIKDEQPEERKLIGRVADRRCRVCKKETIQEIKLFNPDDADQGEVYECTECHNYVDFVKIKV